MKKIKSFIDYFRYLDNPIEALKFKFGFSNHVNLCVNGNKILITDVELLNDIMRMLPEVRNSLKGEYINYVQQFFFEEYFYIDGVKFISYEYPNFKKNNPHDYVAHFYENFTDSETYFDFIDVKNRHIVDIGGNMADSALLFANKGAHVLSFEPVKHLYDLALKNISLNPKLKNNITLIEKGVGSKSGVLSNSSNLVEEYIDDSSQDMEIISFNDLLNDYDFVPDILKMDCEGCEFEIILNYDLSMFNEIIFEHHTKYVHKDYHLLIDKLIEQDFKIKTASNPDFEEIGLIYAYK